METLIKINKKVALENINKRLKEIEEVNQKHYDRRVWEITSQRKTKWFGVVKGEFYTEEEAKSLIKECLDSEWNSDFGGNSYRERKLSNHRLLELRAICERNDTEEIYFSVNDWKWIFTENKYNKFLEMSIDNK